MTRLLDRIDRADLVRTLVVAFCAAAVAAGVSWPTSTVPVLAVIGLVYGCWPILTEAVTDIRHRRMSMELSMLIAVAAAAAIGEWTTALVITAFVLAAEILEDLSMDRGQDALTDLMAFLPHTARVRTGGTGTETVPLADLRPGRTIVVSPGDRIPVDGTVTEGASCVDQSRITGEPLPVDITVGSSVLAGSVNQTGAVDVRVDRVGEDSSYGRIIAAVRQARDSEPPVQRLADRLAARLVYLALAAAAVTWLVTRDLTATISVIIVAGACGVAAGTPLAVLASIARVARSGAFVKDGAHLEALSAVDTVIFDKTGTLTTGTPTVTGVLPAEGVDATTLLRLAAAAESWSEHPLGQAVTDRARDLGLPADPASDFSYIPGQGVSAIVAGHRVAVGNRLLVPDAPPQVSNHSAATEVYIGVDGDYAGTILVEDMIRDSARHAVEQLNSLGLRTVMLTGDAAPAARAVAREVDVSTVHAGLRPEEKMRVIDNERAAGHRVVMVGDGVNDAPALARADVGIAMGSGTDIAQDSADVILITSDLDDLVATVRTARRARRIIMANFTGTIVVDAVGMVLAAFGLLSPILAALVHVGSETAFILNSARLIPPVSSVPAPAAATSGRRAR